MICNWSSFGTSNQVRPRSGEYWRISSIEWEAFSSIWRIKLGWKCTSLVWWTSLSFDRVEERNVEVPSSTFLPVGYRPLHLRMEMKNTGIVRSTREDGCSSANLVLGEVEEPLEGAIGRSFHTQSITLRWSYQRDQLTLTPDLWARARSPIGEHSLRDTEHESNHHYFDEYDSLLHTVPLFLDEWTCALDERRCNSFPTLVGMSRYQRRLRRFDDSNDCRRTWLNSRPQVLLFIIPWLVKYPSVRISISCGKRINGRLQSLLVHPRLHLKTIELECGKHSVDLVFLPALSTRSAHSMAIARIDAVRTDVEFRHSDERRWFTTRHGRLILETKTKSYLTRSTATRRQINRLES